MRAVWLAIGLVGCGSKLPDDVPTWHRDVSPIVQARCVSCHQEGETAAFLPLGDYDVAVEWAPVMARMVESRRMPPFMAQPTDECENPWGFLHDWRLSDEEIATIVEWAEVNAPEGDPDDAVEVAPADVPTLDGPVEELVPTTGYTTTRSADVQDEFVCFSIPFENATERWLDGIEVVPDQRAVVHHVTMFLDQDGGSAALAGDDGVYPCFGGTNVPGAKYVGAWVPGSAPVITPPGSAFHIEPGARFVAQMHYHPTEEPTLDRTSFRMRFTEDAPEDEAILMLIGNFPTALGPGNGLLPGEGDRFGIPEFRIPADAPEHVEEMILTIDNLPVGVEFYVWTLLNHMHYIGVDMKVWLEHPDDTESCLLQTPDWDFDWQQSFDYDAARGDAPVVKRGDVLHIRCTYDNTLGNDGVEKVLDEAGLDAPIDVFLGEGSLDEMCVAGIGIVRKH
jgi:hypothetical protein